MTIVYLNGEYVDQEEARVPVIDRGLLHGFGLFETLRVYGGVPFRLGAHLDRLYASALELGFSLPASREELEEAIPEVVRRCSLKDARVRATVTAGDAATFQEGSALVTAVPIEGLPPEIYEEGVRLISTPLDKGVSLARHKTTNFMAKMLAHKQATEVGAFEAIFRNPSGRISECATSNIFVAKEGKLRTPLVSEGILPGITREIVIRLAAEQGIPASEGLLENEDLFRADEAFITASVKEIVPVVRVGDRTIGSGRPGPLTRRLLQAYRSLVQQECPE